MDNNELNNNSQINNENTLYEINTDINNIQNNTQENQIASTINEQNDFVSTSLNNNSSIEKNNLDNNISSSESVNDVVFEKAKKSRGIIIIIILLLLIVIGVSGYIAYDKFFGKNSNTTEEKETNGLTEVKDKTLIEELRSELVVKDNAGTTEAYITNDVAGLYYSKKILANNAADKRLIGFNVRKYIEENNLKYNENGTQLENGSKLLLTVPKTNINEYMNNKYDTNLNYSYISTNTDDKLDEFYTYLIADETNYKITLTDHSKASTILKTKFVRAEEDENNIYVYDKYVKCSAEAGWVGCILSEDEGLGVNSTISCTESSEINEKCPIKGNEEKLAEYALNNMSNKLKTYKHTFKKLDGNYFWISSEIIE